ncbi:hypothetical protein C1I97_02440 [Streptomyces sp. NTH33]|uniref:hypothetical protein n=1 Tax=Streptomyces sp. NTH33 TaxID=1735453 RepID=UPI000DA7369F|nr:hypothetical protein [Streptomyces sp. NTH33]PZH19638.1 hypothetical protein C1I97_02440 [Streptomyces sp. NTH33]
MPEGRPQRSNKSRLALVALLTGLGAWLGVVCYSIATEDPPGAPSLTALAGRVEKAAAGRDADALQTLFDEDTVSDGYAAGFLGRLGEHPPPLRARVGHRGGHDFVLLRSARDDSLCTAWHVTERDGRRLLDGVPPAEDLCAR